MWNFQLMNPDQDVFTLRDCELLVSLAQGGSLKAAAVRLNLTPSALSHRLGELEGRVSFPLVEHHGHLTLTPGAWRLVPRAQEILTSLERLNRELEGGPDVRRVGISNLLLRSGWQEALADLTMSDARVRWDFVSGHSDQVENWVEEGRLDVGLVRLERRRPGLRYDWVEDDQLLAAARPDIPRGGRCETWPWVLYAATMGHGQAVEEALKEAGWLLIPRVRVDSFDLALTLVKRGAVSVFPRSVIQADLAQQKLSEVVVPGVIWPVRRTALICRGEPPRWAETLWRALRRLDTLGGGA